MRDSSRGWGEPASRPASPVPGTRSQFRLTPREQLRFERAIAGIDAANSADPNWIWIDGRERPKELAMAERVTGWLEVLRPNASLELRLAARAHHIRRWTIDRTSFPAGTAGYHRWRTRLQLFHAEQAGILLAGEGYPEDTILRVQALIRKRGLERDPECQALEDAICLAFFEVQLEGIAARMPWAKLVDVIRRTLRKMSEPAITLLSRLRLGERSTRLLEAATRAD